VQSLFEFSKILKKAKLFGMFFSSLMHIVILSLILLKGSYPEFVERSSLIPNKFKYLRCIQLFKKLLKVQSWLTIIFLKSNISKFVQFENILFIQVTCEVSKLLKFKEVNDLQFKNIEPISKTLDVSNDDKSTDSNDSHSLNIEYKSMAFGV
jgi:hypothetical protein